MKLKTQTQHTKLNTDESQVIIRGPDLVHAPPVLPLAAEILASFLTVI